MGNNKKHKKITKANTLERINPKKLPWFGKKTLFEHIERYRFATGFVKNKTVIELGCGNGYGSQMLCKAGAKKVIGVDNHQNTITYAQKHFSHENLSYVTADASATGLPPRNADIVIAFETIEHLTDPEAMINEAKRLLKPHGLFILSTPNADVSFNDNPYHTKEFTLKELRILLKEFSIHSIHGQRRVNSFIINQYKMLAGKFPAFLRFLFHIRPWENYSIRKLPKLSDTAYVYFIIVCEKKTTQR